MFSGKQLDLLFWLLSINGVDDVPSVRQMKDRQKSLHDMIGINTVKFDGSFGHPYYVNDIGHIIGQVLLLALSPCALPVKFNTRAPFRI